MVPKVCAHVAENLPLGGLAAVALTGTRLRLMLMEPWMRRVWQEKMTGRPFVGRNLLEHVRAGLSDVRQLERLREIWQWGPADAKVNRNEIHMRLCWHGELAAAQWATESFGFDLKDALSAGSAVFIEACAGGNLLLVKWMVCRFGLKANDICPATWARIRTRLREGSRAVLAWLEENHFVLRDEAVPSC